MCLSDTKPSTSISNIYSLRTPMDRDSIKCVQAKGLVVPDDSAPTPSLSVLCPRSPEIFLIFAATVRKNLVKTR